jgi:HK97 family phage major capsid protein/HK97 family phage prohead protease
MPERDFDGNIEFRSGSGSSDDGDGRTFTGYAAVFDQPTQIRGWEGTFNERMKKGAFRKTLRERQPIMQFDHGHDSRVGSTPIGNYTSLREDDNGLAVEARLFDNPVVEPVRQAIEAGAIRGMSIKFAITREQWRDANGKVVKPDELGQLLYEPGERGPLEREIREVRLMEAGPVVNPAYPQTTAAVRSADDVEQDERQSRIDDLVSSYARTFEDDESEEREEVEETDDAEEREEEIPDPWDNAEAQFIAAGFTPESVAHAVEARDISLLEHSAAHTSEAEEVEDAQEGTARAGQGDITEERAKSPENNTKSAQTQRKAEKTMPKTLDELIARQAEIEARLAELGEGDETRDMSDEENEEFDSLTTERADVIKRQERIAERMKVLKGLAASGSSERGSDKGAPAFHRERTSSEIYDLAEMRKVASDGDHFLSLVDDNAKRAIERAKFGAKDKAAAQEHVTELLEDVDTDSRELAKRVLLTGSAEYERAFAKLLRHGSDALCTPEERAALVRAASVPQALGTDGAGGYAVPFQLDPTVILTNAGVVNPIREMARVEQIVGKEWQGVTSAGSTVVRGPEAGEAPDSGFTVAQPTLRTNRVQGFVAFNIEIDLSWNALRSEITRMLVDGKAREEDSFITGDGSTGQQPGGVLGSLSGNTVDTAAASTFGPGDVYALEAALDPRWEPNAQWLAHKTVYHKIRQFDTAGGAQLWAHIGDGQPARLLDYVDRRSSAMPAYATTDNAKLMLFGDFQQFLIVDRIGMTVELIPNLLGANGRPTGQRGVYAVWMNNSKILVPSAFKVLQIKAAA